MKCLHLKYVILELVSLFRTYIEYNIKDLRKLEQILRDSGHMGRNEKWAGKCVHSL